MRLAWIDRGGSVIAFAALCVACGGSTGTGTAGDAGLGGSQSGGSGGFGAVGGSSVGGAPGGGGSSSGGGSFGGAGGIGGTACTPPAAGTLQGDFLLTVSAKLSPKKPFLFHAIVNTVDIAGETALGMSIEPLDAQDRTTPVGPLATLTPAQIDAQGNLVNAGPWQLSIPGAANPITGSDVEAEASLAGSICGVQTFYCGDVSGSISKPIAYDLSGSTFTLERYMPPQTPPPLINCNKDAADPPAAPP